METKSFAVFESDLPDDSIEEGGKIIVPGGQNILRLVCSNLRQSGFSAKEPSQYRFYGWNSEFKLGKNIVWFLLQQPGPWLLIVEARTTWFCSSHDKELCLNEGVRIIHDALTSDPRIKLRQWMTKSDYESTGL
jgi:hypothetical protein